VNNPAFPDQEATPEVKGDLLMLKEHHFDANRGMIFHFHHKTAKSSPKPFRFFHPYFGQNPRSIETLNITTIRAG
jgi:hypothetical protein